MTKPDRQSLEPAARLTLIAGLCYAVGLLCSQAHHAIRGNPGPASWQILSVSHLLFGGLCFAIPALVMLGLHAAVSAGPFKDIMRGAVLRSPRATYWRLSSKYILWPSLGSVAVMYVVTGFNVPIALGYMIVLLLSITALIVALHRYVTKFTPSQLDEVSGTEYLEEITGLHQRDLRPTLYLTFVAGTIGMYLYPIADQAFGGGKPVVAEVVLKEDALRQLDSRFATIQGMQIELYPSPPYFLGIRNTDGRYLLVPRADVALIRLTADTGAPFLLRTRQ